MALQVVPDLTKFMDSVHSKMMQAQQMLGKLEIEGGGSANQATQLPLLIIDISNAISHPTLATYSMAMHLVVNL